MTVTSHARAATSGPQPKITRESCRAGPEEVSPIFLAPSMNALPLGFV